MSPLTGDEFLGVAIKGQAELEIKFSKLTKALDFREILDQSAAILLNDIRTRFLQKIDSGGVPWLPSQAAQNREKAGKGGGTLYDTGNLFHSLQVFAIGDDSRGLGTDVRYGAFHNYGTVTLPKREFLAFGDGDIQTVQEFLQKRISEAIA